MATSFFVDNSIFIHPVHEIMIDTEFSVPSLFKLLPFIFTVLFSVFAIVLSEFLPGSIINFKLSRFGYNLFGFFNQRFLVEMFYNNYITNLVLYLGGQTTKVLDKGSIEFIGPFGLEKGLLKLSKSLTKLSTGVVTSYALYILIGFIFFILFGLLSISYEDSQNLLLLVLICTLSALYVEHEYKQSINTKISGERLHFVSLPSKSTPFKVGFGGLSFSKNNVKGKPSYHTITAGLSKSIGYATDANSFEPKASLSSDFLE
ncbi:hypothetical protein GCM10023339_74010 [Alloalcanivorax gelatiniphagus]